MQIHLKIMTLSGTYKKIPNPKYPAAFLRPKNSWIEDEDAPPVTLCEIAVYK
jgi:hypothetical protein